MKKFTTVLISCLLIVSGIKAQSLEWKRLDHSYKEALEINGQVGPILAKGKIVYPFYNLLSWDTKEATLGTLNTLGIAIYDTSTKTWQLPNLDLATTFSLPIGVTQQTYSIRERYNAKNQYIISFRIGGTGYDKNGIAILDMSSPEPKLSLLTKHLYDFGILDAMELQNGNIAVSMFYNKYDANKNIPYNAAIYLKDKDSMLLIPSTASRSGSFLAMLGDTAFSFTTQKSPSSGNNFTIVNQNGTYQVGPLGNVGQSLLFTIDSKDGVLAGYMGSVFGTNSAAGICLKGETNWKIAAINGVDDLVSYSDVNQICIRSQKGFDLVLDQTGTDYTKWKVRHINDGDGIYCLQYKQDTGWSLISFSKPETNYDYMATTFPIDHPSQKKQGYEWDYGTPEHVFQYGTHFYGWGFNFIGELSPKDTTSGIKSINAVTLKIYPNPAIGNTLYVDGISKTINYEITNVIGKIVQKGTTNGGIPIEFLADNNIYFIKLDSGLNPIKFIKQ